MVYDAFGAQPGTSLMGQSGFLTCSRERPCIKKIVDMFLISILRTGMKKIIGKRCYGFKTDTRSVESDLDLNPMISGCMIKIFKNYDGDQMIKEIREYLSESEL